MEEKKKPKYINLNDRKLDKENTPIGKVDAYLKMRYKEMYFDVIRDEVHFNDSDKNFDDVYTDLKFKGIKISTKDLEIYLRSDRITKKDPFKIYFDKVKHQDDHDYINEMSYHIKTDDQEYWQVMFKKHVVRCVKQALEQGHWTNRTVIVMRSEKENLGKSTFIRKLNPFGSLYHIEKFDKDTGLALTKTFFFNIEEIENMHGEQFNRLKAMISLPDNNQRRLFTQQFYSKPRRASIWASTNKEDFLGTGENSRWNIHQVMDIDFNYEQVDLDKFWGQAVNLLDEGFDYELTAEEFSRSKMTAREFKFKNNEAKFIYENLKKTQNKNNFANASVVNQYFAQVHGFRNLHVQRTGTALTEGGFERSNDGNGIKGYLIETMEGDNLKDAINRATGNVNFPQKEYTKYSKNNKNDGGEFFEVGGEKGEDVLF